MLRLVPQQVDYFVACLLAPTLFEFAYATHAHRISQRGVAVKLQVYKTLNKGWAVRTLEDIERGANRFITNEVDLHLAAAVRSIFIYGCRSLCDGVRGRDH